MKRLFTIFFAALLILSCGDDSQDSSTYKDGVFVVNQGAFGSGTGTLSFKRNGVDSISQDVFIAANAGSFLGNIAQSMIEHDDKKYVAINNGGEIKILEDETLISLGSISGINQPRFFASNGSKLYVSSWGDTGSNGAVYEIGTENNTLSPAIVEGNGPEGMVLDNDILYIAKGGGFGLDSVVVIVDTDDNSIIKTLVVGDNPEQIVKDDNGDIFVICGGFTDFVNPENSTDGALVMISNQEIVKTMSIPNGSNRLTIDTDRHNLYYISSSQVNKYSILDETNSVLSVSSGFAYGLGFDDSEGLLYVADAKDFASQGEVIIINRDDVEVDRFTTGIIPGSFHFD